MQNRTGKISLLRGILCGYGSALIAILILGSGYVQAQVSSNVTFRDQLTYAQDMSDVWGWRNPADGREYAIATTTNAVSIVDVTNPDNISQVQNFPGVSTLWRDAKTWGNYAYVVNEGSGGMLIIDMSGLPGSATSTSWNGGIGFSTAHNIFIDEFGYGYLCGSNGGLGTVIIDIDANPTNPPVVGSYTTRYVHDLYVENNIMYTAEINNGIFSVIDVSNKAMPTVLATQSTSSNFTHNIWLSTDGDYVFTTDEVSGANIDAYDISDLSDIQEVDRFRPNTSSSSIPHNTFVNGNFLVTAWYRDGMRITDVTVPENMIEVGYYDTSPFSGSGFNGAWGTYPYLPSGNVLITDIEEGLFVVTPSYVGAAFVAGTVTDATTSGLIFDATVALSGGPSTSTDILGQYQTGIANGGTYTIVVSKPGYITQTISGVSLSAGSTTTLNVSLTPNTPVTVSGQVQNAATSAGVGFAEVLFVDAAGNKITTTANATGNYSISVFNDTYSIIAGQWGYVTEELSGVTVSGASSPLNIALDEGYYDDFVFDFGWGLNNSATTGIWVRGEPVGTDFEGNQANPEVDISGDIADQCYMTGNGGGSGGNDDIDGGRTVLISPSFDLSGYADPYVDYSRWFYNGGGSGSPNDSLVVTLSNGSTTAVIETVIDGDPTESTWTESSIRVSDFLTPTSNMQIRFASSDLPSAGGHIVEAAVDGFAVIEGGVVAGCNAPTNPVANVTGSTSVTVSWDAIPGAVIYQAQGRKAGTSTFKAITTSTNSRTISTLKANTTYEWQVRVQCADLSISPFSTLGSFTTFALRETNEFQGISPNPISEGLAHVRFEAAKAGKVQISILSYNGSIMHQEQYSAATGVNAVPVTVEELPNGMYLVQVTGNDFEFTGRLNVVR